MKKTILLLMFLFVGMVSFANNVPVKSSSQNSSSVLTEMLNKSINNSIEATRPDVNSENVSVTIHKINIRYLADECTVTLTASIGYNSSYVQISVSATAATCDAALAAAAGALKKAKLLLHSFY